MCAKFQLISLSRLGDMAKTKRLYICFVFLLYFWFVIVLDKFQELFIHKNLMASSLGHSHKLKILLPFLYIEFKGRKEFLLQP